MSATNWDPCPRCMDRREKHLAHEQRRVDAAYGSVSVEEFDRMRADLAIEREARPEATFREDYEIWGADRGQVQVRYSGECTKCGLNLKFKHTHPLFVGEES